MGAAGRVGHRVVRGEASDTLAARRRRALRKHGGGVASQGQRGPRGPLWSRVWSALMRALQLRLCEPVLVLTGAKCSDLLRSGSDWLRLIFCGQTLGHIVHSLF